MCASVARNRRVRSPHCSVSPSSAFFLIASKLGPRQLALDHLRNPARDDGLRRHLSSARAGRVRAWPLLLAQSPAATPTGPPPRFLAPRTAILCGWRLSRQKRIATAMAARMASLRSWLLGATRSLARLVALTSLVGLTGAGSESRTTWIHVAPFGGVGRTQRQPVHARQEHFAAVCAQVAEQAHAGLAGLRARVDSTRWWPDARGWLRALDRDSR